MFQKTPNGGPHNDEGQVNMTPLIDVSLVLVVILMLATPLAFESSIGVRSSDAKARQAPREEKVEYVQLSVVSEDSVRVNRTTVSRARLVQTLRPILDESTRRQVLVTCQAGVSHGAFVDVLDLAKLSGAGDIAVVGRK